MKFDEEGKPIADDDTDVDEQCAAVASYMPAPVSGGTLHLIRALAMAGKYGPKKKPEDPPAGG